MGFGRCQLPDDDTCDCEKFEWKGYTQVYPDTPCKGCGHLFTFHMYVFIAIILLISIYFAFELLGAKIEKNGS